MVEITKDILTGGVAVAIITVISKLIFRFWDEKNQKDKDSKEAKINKFEQSDEVQSMIDRVVYKSDVERFLILKTENGGGKPRIGANLYSSVLFESVKPPIASVKEDYQRLLVDPMYVKMLSDINIHIPNILITEKMKSGILKRLYLLEGVKYSEVHYIGETESAFYYCSVATTKSDESFNEVNNRVEIEIAVNRIRRLFNR